MVYDIAIIGSGPAGVSAVINAKILNKSYIWLSAKSTSDKVSKAELIKNYPGLPSVTGAELNWTFKNHCDAMYIENTQGIVTGVYETGDKFTLLVGNKDYEAKTVILCLGVQSKKPLDGEELFLGRGVSYCATCDGNFFRGRDVVVVGGGDTAAADAIYLSRICNKVHLVHRRDTLRATAIYHQRLRELGNLEFVWDSEVVNYLAEDGKVGGVRVRSTKNGSERDIACAAVFIAIGMRPNTEFLEGALPLDETGYIIADERGATQVQGVFAAGDVRTKVLRQAVTAVSDGAVCADEIAEFLS